MRLIIAGGGTGGHLFPAMAIANALQGIEPRAEVLFVGTRHGIEARILPERGLPVRFISTRGIRKTGLMNRLFAVGELPLAVTQSMRLIRAFQPDVVLGVGGYASGPVVAAAVLLRLPTAIQEQNSVMGTTNRLLARFVDRIFVSWEGTEPRTAPEKTILTGNPIRQDLFDSPPYPDNKDRFKLLVFGGSRGASSINRAFADHIELLKPFAGKMGVVHQTGKEERAAVEAAYRAAGVACLVTEFIDDIGSFYRWADLVVCRSGASSLAELTAFGKPAVVTPYPYAIGDHQMKNARHFEAAGAVRIIPDSELASGALVKAVAELMSNEIARAAMARRSRQMGRPEAATRIAEHILQMARSRK
ncbi:MAG: undecaprenyldiphospho-muramoylpentapeptide beta-N-acetylglucosaminyltransferase [Desulfomonilaceae bacterium]